MRSKKLMGCRKLKLLEFGVNGLGWAAIEPS